MKTVFGIISILFLLTAIILAFFTILSASPFWAIGYIFYCLIGIFMITYFFCRKCVDKERCPHVIFGKIACFFGTPNLEPYSLVESIFTVFGVLLLVVPPQFWLISKHSSLLIFWGLIVLAFLLITLNICNRCNHRLCPFCRNKTQTQ